MGSPRFFGFVIGAAHPAGVAADWLATTWDQNAGLAGPTPSVALIEEIAGRWLADLLGIPPTASFALVTGCQMAHVTALAAARNRVLADAGHDVERARARSARRRSGCSPGEERHVTVDRALRLLGLRAPTASSSWRSTRTARCAPTRWQAALAIGEPGTPTIVIAQVGNVNTGAMRPDARGRAPPGEAAGAWVHVDGAFGLWAAASRSRRGTIAGAEHADSWATDGHKWLQVPYDCGIAFVRDREAHRAAMAFTAAYLVQDATGPREPMDWTPEFSRRARGAGGLRDPARARPRRASASSSTACARARTRFADRLPARGLRGAVARAQPGARRRSGPTRATDAALAAIQAEGTCWPSGTTWRGRRCIRISVCSHLTTFDDVDRSVDAMAAAARR